MKRNQTIVLFAALIVLTGYSYQLFKQTTLDFSTDEEPFRSMVMPLKEVMGASYMDGGSVSLHVTDAGGMKYQVFFPIDYDNLYDSHPTAFPGKINDWGRVPELKDPARAKAIAIQLLKDYRCPVNHPDMEPFDTNDHARRLLSHPPSNMTDRLERKVVKLLK
ncbi:MAG: hypothetical protein EOP88_20290 [Verrucomicrobiaceae bacterium]|nr:MAG: hypothetical protein EOP88_20290 [Verrucomicrobiaceae bacterium]